jgi:hypothetical protein
VNSNTQAPVNNTRRPGRARSNTAHSYQERYEPVKEENLQPPPPPRTTIGSRSPSSSRPNEPLRDRSNSASMRAGLNRPSTFEGPTQLRRDESPAAAYSPNRVHSDLSVRTTRTSLRPISKVYDNYQGDSNSHGNVSPYDERSESPATSQAGYFSRNPSFTAVDTAGTTGIKKGPPPPPPSRATKPKPPPPPPSKRHLVGA